MRTLLINAVVDICYILARVARLVKGNVKNQRRRRYTTMMTPHTTAAAARPPAMMRMTGLSRPCASCAGSRASDEASGCAALDEDALALDEEALSGVPDEDALALDDAADDEAGALDELAAPVAGMYSVRTCRPQTVQT